MEENSLIKAFDLYSFYSNVSLEHKTPYDNKPLMLEMKYSYLSEDRSQAMRKQGISNIYQSRRNKTITENKIEVKVDNQLKKIYDSSSVVVRVTETVLKSIIKDGQIKNQFETGTSGGALSPRLREETEERVMSVPKNTNPKDRPIYGMLFPNIYKSDIEMLQKEISNGLGSWYGECIIVLNKTIIEPYMTLTIGDSLDYRNELKASNIKNLKYMGSSSSMGQNIYRLRKANIETLHSKSSYRDQYIEVQIHGLENHFLSVVQCVIFAEEPKNTDILMDLYAKKIPYKVLSYDLEKESNRKVM